MSNLGTNMRQGLKMRDKHFSKAEIVPDVIEPQTKLANCCTVLFFLQYELEQLKGKYV